MRLHEERVPKLCGADVELGNAILGLTREGGTGREASRILLAEIDGVPGPGPSETDGSGKAREHPDPQDWGRKYLPATGGCVYIDLDHLELATPEVLGAHEHVAAWHAMLRIARRAMESANRRLPRRLRVQVLVNNSDGFSHAYGSHMSFLVTRAAWESLFHQRLTQLLCLAAYQASSIVFTGQGKVGSENGAPRVDYQIAQRADFFEQIVGDQTTFARPIVNSRDEALCGSIGAANGAARPSHAMARVHCIFFDSTLCHVATLLRVGVTQIVLAMLESGWVDLELVLDAPVDALRRWSHDPDLRATARTIEGRDWTAVDLQRRFCEAATTFVESGGADGIVPRAGEIVALWADTLDRLAARDFEVLAPRLDWVLKRRILTQALERRPDLGWRSPELKVLDHLYGSLEADEGLYWAYEEAGFVETVATGDEIDRLVHAPPETTRAWTRAMLLRAAAADEVEHVDWDRIRLRPRSKGWGDAVEIELANPLGFTRAQMESVFATEEETDEAEAKDDRLEDVLARLRGWAEPRTASR